MATAKSPLSLYAETPEEEAPIQAYRDAQQKLIEAMEGRKQLFDPVLKFIPGFADLKVYAAEPGTDIDLVPLRRPVTVHDLLTHTSGLTYHFLEYGGVEEMYREARVSSRTRLA